MVFSALLVLILRFLIKGKVGLNFGDDIVAQR